MQLAVVLRESWKVSGVGFVLRGSTLTCNQRRPRKETRLYHTTASCYADMDLYDILKVPNDATQARIRRAYKELYVKYHPELNNSPEAQTKFAEVSKAYSVLSQIELRKKYDKGIFFEYPESEQAEFDEVPQLQLTRKQQEMAEELSKRHQRDNSMVILLFMVPFMTAMGFFKLYWNDELPDVYTQNPKAVVPR